LTGGTHTPYAPGMSKTIYQHRAIHNTSKQHIMRHTSHAVSHIGVCKNHIKTILYNKRRAYISSPPDARFVPMTQSPDTKSV